MFTNFNFQALDIDAITVSFAMASPARESRGLKQALRHLAICTNVAAYTSRAAVLKKLNF